MGVEGENLPYILNTAILEGLEFRLISHWSIGIFIRRQCAVINVWKAFNISTV